MKACMVAYAVYERDNRVMRYSEALVARGDTVDVIALRRPGQSRSCRYRGVNLLRIQKRVPDESQAPFAYLARLLAFLVKSFFVLAWRHLRHRYDVIHIHSVPDFEVFAALIPRILGAKIILDIHDIVPEFYACKFGKNKESVVFRLLVATERLSVAYAHHTIVANDIWRDRLLSRSAVAARCSTIMNYPDPAIFQSKSRGDKSNRFVILYPGTISYHQGLDVAVSAFARVAHEMPGARFDIYGEGPDRRSIEALVVKLGLTDRIAIHGLVPMVEVADIMAAADLGVIPKRRDSFGDEAFSTKSLEFMALGVPLIISDTTIDRQYFPPSVVQFFNAGDETDLAAKMLALYRSPEARARLSEAGRAFAAENSWEQKKDVYFRLVDALVQKTDK